MLFKIALAILRAQAPFVLSAKSYGAGNEMSTNAHVCG
jgi:hypothetical protein